MTLRIAMWSGPRNISTALMRAFENRADTAVWDEPFYAHYLKTTGIDHPMAEEIVVAHEADWDRVVTGCSGPAPGGAAVFYQKHITHHMPADADLSWATALANCFLIRNPAAVALSYNKKRDEITAADLGFERQGEIFDVIAAQSAETPPILDASDVLSAPQAMLRALCGRLGLNFDPAMLRWPAGGRESDGIWGRHWYQAVEASTGFAPPVQARGDVPERLGDIVDACRPAYERLYAQRLTP